MESIYKTTLGTHIDLDSIICIDFITDIFWKNPRPVAILITCRLLDKPINYRMRNDIESVETDCKFEYDHAEAHYLDLLNAWKEYKRNKYKLNLK